MARNKTTQRTLPGNSSEVHRDRQTKCNCKSKSSSACRPKLSTRCFQALFRTPKLHCLALANPINLDAVVLCAHCLLHLVVALAVVVADPSMRPARVGNAVFSPFLASTVEVRTVPGPGRLLSTEPRLHSTGCNTQPRGDHAVYFGTLQSRRVVAMS